MKQKITFGDTVEQQTAIEMIDSCPLQVANELDALPINKVLEALAEMEIDTEKAGYILDLLKERSFRFLVKYLQNSIAKVEDKNLKGLLEGIRVVLVRTTAETYEEIAEGFQAAGAELPDNTYGLKEALYNLSFELDGFNSYSTFHAMVDFKEAIRSESKTYSPKRLYTKAQVELIKEKAFEEGYRKAVQSQSVIKKSKRFSKLDL